MDSSEEYDAVVVGSGPNGLAAGVTLARAGCRVLLLERQSSIGGGVRSENLTLPGFVHDVCSAIHPLAVGSRFFRELKGQLPLDWIHPTIPLAHPLHGGRVALLHRSIDETALGLGRDRERYRRLLNPWVEGWEALIDELLQPVVHLPRHPLRLANFGLHSLQSASGFAKTKFQTEEARALFAGLAGHSLLPLDATASAAIGLVLAILGHSVGWPMPRGGACRIGNALADYFQSLGGRIETNQNVDHLRELPRSRAIILDVTPRQFRSMAKGWLTPREDRALGRYRYGPGVFKLDYALEGPIPWSNEDCKRAGTVHVGGTLEEIAHAESQVAAGKIPDRPFVLVAQPTVFDPTRAPAGHHIAWAYCHVPLGSTVDLRQSIEDQIERFAPGFRRRILAVSARNTADLERRNPNLVEGDIGGGSCHLAQLIFRPSMRLNPYRTGIRGVYLGSASTPPGAGVHGMCGYLAARTALHDLKRGRRYHYHPR